MKLEHSLTPYTQINSKWIKYLNVRLDTIKLLEEIIGRNLFDINHSKTFFDPPPSIMKIYKQKQNKWDIIFFLINLFIYLFLAALVLHCCTWAFFCCIEQGLLFVVVHVFLIAVSSLVVEQGL